MPDFEIICPGCGCHNTLVSSVTKTVTYTIEAIERPSKPGHGTYTLNRCANSEEKHRIWSCLTPDCAWKTSSIPMSQDIVREVKEDNG